ncbi:phosphoribosylformylglycinamidine synthase subunit PurS [Caldivirga maquilingensis]|uniref:Uncharacterized protein n=1 Tax=Caldivirga maquilingensis (strain ATCC 700844 / DSM 13496 / JCM 10307 / IC-167) TaxID=397948 RepID=A8MCJ6_CALMQ|nr:phosphoribosylformylglycinamidine synthase subunit PurS [Caldivirga maquilingensis]ABW01502.1 hypothetical protein Cmaq_0662 [Caldivirga maquilingensis IC-167]
MEAGNTIKPIGLYKVHVAVVLKGSRDPEGETILRDVVLASGVDYVVKVTSGKYLSFTVKSSDGEEAIKLVTNLCRDLRIFNPTVHKLIVLGVEYGDGSGY